MHRSHDQDARKLMAYHYYTFFRGWLLLSRVLSELRLIGCRCIRQFLELIL